MNDKPGVIERSECITHIVGRTIVDAHLGKDSGGYDLFQLTLDNGDIVEVEERGQCGWFRMQVFPPVPKPRLQDAPDAPSYDDLCILLAYLMGNPGEYFQQRSDGTVACFVDECEGWTMQRDAVGVPANVTLTATRFINHMKGE